MGTISSVTTRTPARVYHGFLYNGLTFTTIDDPSANDRDRSGTLPSGISGSAIVGSYQDSNNNFQGFLYDGSAFTNLNLSWDTFASGISGGTLVGTTYWSSYQGFMLTGGTMTTLSDPAGVNGTFAQGISAGKIVGYYEDSRYVYHGFLYDGMSYTTLDDTAIAGLPNERTWAYGISDDDVVGYYTQSGLNHGFLYDGSSYIPLDDPLAGTAFNDGTFAFGISGNTVVGYYTDSSALNHGFIATVPEPASVVLLAAGAAALVFCRRLPLSDGLRLAAKVARKAPGSRPRPPRSSAPRSP